MLNQIKLFFGGNGSQITGKRTLDQFVVYFLKSQEPFQHLQMKQEEIKHVSSESHLSSTEYKPNPPQKLCSHGCVFMLNLQSLVLWQGWGLTQGLGKTQLKSSGSRWASCLSRLRVRLSKSPVSIGPNHLSDRPPLCNWGLRQFPRILSLLVPEGRPPPRIALFPWKKNYWGTQSA